MGLPRVEAPTLKSLLRRGSHCYLRVSTKRPIPKHRPTGKEGCLQAKLQTLRINHWVRGARVTHQRMLNHCGFSSSRTSISYLLYGFASYLVHWLSRYSSRYSSRCSSRCFSRERREIATSVMNTRLLFRRNPRRYRYSLRRRFKRSE